MQLVDADGAGAGPWKLTNRYLYGDAVDLVLADEQLPSGGIGLTSVSYTTGNVLWPLFDQLGSVRDVVDSNGVIRQHLVFDSFGNRLSETDYNTSGVVIPSTDPAAVDELFGYTGREWDKDVGLQYNRARWYDPAQGRWLSQDPIGFAAGDVNLYRYVGNEAPGATDPSGLTPPDDDMPQREPGHGTNANRERHSQAERARRLQQQNALRRKVQEQKNDVLNDAFQRLDRAIADCEDQLKTAERKMLKGGANAAEYAKEVEQLRESISRLKEIEIVVDAGEIVDIKNLDDLTEEAFGRIVQEGWKAVDNQSPGSYSLCRYCGRGMDLPRESPG